MIRKIAARYRHRSIETPPCRRGNMRPHQPNRCDRNDSGSIARAILSRNAPHLRECSSESTLHKTQRERRSIATMATRHGLRNAPRHRHQRASADPWPGKMTPLCAPEECHRVRR